MQCRRPQFDSWVGKIPWRRDRLHIPVFLGFAVGSDSKESTCNAGDLGSIPGLGRSPGGGHGNQLQYSCLENPYGQRSLEGNSPWVAESDTTSDFHFTSAIKSLLLWLSGQKSACSAGAPGEAGSIPGSGRSPGRGCGNLLQYSCLENPMDRGAWQAIVHRIAKTGT